MLRETKYFFLKLTHSLFILSTFPSTLSWPPPSSEIHYLLSCALLLPLITSCMGSHERRVSPYCLMLDKEPFVAVGTCREDMTGRRKHFQGNAPCYTKKFCDGFREYSYLTVTWQSWVSACSGGFVSECVPVAGPLYLELAQPAFYPCILLAVVALLKCCFPYG